MFISANAHFCHLTTGMHGKRGELGGLSLRAVRRPTGDARTDAGSFALVQRPESARHVFGPRNHGVD